MGVFHRIGHAPLVLHAVALFLVLVCLAMIVDVDGGVYDADEGALLMQVRVLVDEGTWDTELPTADLDPEGIFAAVASGRVEDGRITPFPVRPALVLVTARLWDLGGVVLATIPGLIGLVVAAAVAADLARSIDARARAMTFWLAGLASPLLFQSLALQGHGPAVGLAAAMMWCALNAESKALSGRTLLLAGALATGAGAALFRREVVVLASAFLLVGVVHDVRNRHTRYSLGAGVGLLGTMGGTIADQLLTRALIGEGLRAAPVSGDESLWIDRLLGFLSTVNPGYEGDPVTAAALAMASAAVLMIAATRYRARNDASELVAGLGLAAGLLAVRLAVGSRHMVQGLIPAFPLAAAAFILAVPERSETRLRVLWTTSLLFLALVGMTQYRAGGGFEWASRYTAVGLPAALPVVGVTIVRLSDRLPLKRRTAQVAVVSLLTVAVAPAVMGLVAQHHARRTNAASTVLIHNLAAAAGTDVIVSTHPEIPRASPDQLVSGLRWLWVPPEYFDLVLPRILASGVGEVVLVTKEPDEALEALHASSWSAEVASVRDENPGRALFAIIRSGQVSR